MGINLHIIKRHIFSYEKMPEHLKELQNAVMEKSKQCLSYREEAPVIESVSKDAELPKFTPEQFPEIFAQGAFLGKWVGDTGRRPLLLHKVRQGCCL
jgi:hypothetical protein